MDNQSHHEPPLLVINSNVTAEDTIRFAFFHHYSKPATKIMLIVFVLLIVLINGQFLFSQGKPDTTFQILYFAVVFTLIMMPVLIYIKARKNYVTQKNFSQPIQWKFGHDAIEATGETFSSTFTWQNLYKIAENKHSFLLYHSSSLANIIPKRHMSEEQILQFRQIVNERPHLKTELVVIDPVNNSANTQLRLASLPMRIINTFIDTIVFLLLWALFSFCMILLILVLNVSDETSDSLLNINWYVLLPLYFAYYALMESRLQKTVGKMLTRTRVVSTNGSKPSVSQILIRTMSRMIPFEFISFFFGSAGLHDQLSNTRVVQLPREINRESSIVSRE